MRQHETQAQPCLVGLTGWETAERLHHAPHVAAAARHPETDHGVLAGIVPVRTLAQALWWYLAGCIIIYLTFVSSPHALESGPLAAQTLSCCPRGQHSARSTAHAIGSLCWLPAANAVCCRSRMLLLLDTVLLHAWCAGGMQQRVSCCWPACSRCCVCGRPAWQPWIQSCLSCSKN